MFLSLCCVICVSICFVAGGLLIIEVYAYENAKPNLRPTAKPKLIYYDDYIDEPSTEPSMEPSISIV
jgi:hypothetical protein